MTSERLQAEAQMPTINGDGWERLTDIAASSAVIYGLPDLNGRAVVAAVTAIFITSFVAEHVHVRGHELHDAVA